MMFTKSVYFVCAGERTPTLIVLIILLLIFGVITFVLFVVYIRGKHAHTGVHTHTYRNLQSHRLLETGIVFDNDQTTRLHNS